MSKGVLLIALGKHYSRLAFNMAKSIHQYSDVEIACITDETDSSLLTEYSDIIRPKLDDYLEEYQFNPFKLKTYMYDLSPFEHTIYLDVDGIVLKDIDPLFRFKFKVQEVAKYTYETAEGCDMVWVKKAGLCLRDVFDAWNLPHDREYPEHNSSIVIFNRSKKNEKYFERVKKNYFDRKLNFKPIGGLYPDELAFNLASAQLKHYSDKPSLKPIYFFWENKMLAGEQIRTNYFVLGMAGGFHNTKLKHIYETTVKQFSPYWKWDSMQKIFHKKR